MKKIQQIIQHFIDFGPLYTVLTVAFLLGWASILNLCENEAEHGKIELIGKCEFIKLHTGKLNTFTYIHNPVCPNCAKK